MQKSVNSQLSYPVSHPSPAVPSDGTKFKQKSAVSSPVTFVTFILFFVLGLIINQHLTEKQKLQGSL